MLKEAICCCLEAYCLKCLLIYYAFLRWKYELKNDVIALKWTEGNLIRPSVRLFSKINVNFTKYIKIEISVSGNMYKWQIPNRGNFQVWLKNTQVLIIRKKKYTVWSQLRTLQRNTSVQTTVDSCSRAYQLAITNFWTKTQISFWNHKARIFSCNKAFLVVNISPFHHSAIQSFHRMASPC